MPTPSLLDDLTNAGVSVWLDSLDRGRLSDGTLAGLISDSAVTGVTSNPTIFDTALSATSAYEDQLRDLNLRGSDVREAARLLMTRDIRSACDLLRPVHDRTRGHDGYVSIEVDPGLAHDSAASLAEARDLAWMVDRPNAMIKIPGRAESLAAITAAIAEGICINVTLIFSPDAYESVLDAYLSGLEQARTAASTSGTSDRSPPSSSRGSTPKSIGSSAPSAPTNHCVSGVGRVWRPPSTSTAATWPARDRRVGSSLNRPVPIASGLCGHRLERKIPDTTP